MKKNYTPRKQRTSDELMELHKQERDKRKTLSQQYQINLLIAIGYWKSEQEPYFPHPLVFQYSNWATNEKEMVIIHLQSSKVIGKWLGRSWCRFGCEEIHMGATCLTDGIYIYPEGLVHYLIDHNVRLPVEFIEHVKTYTPIEINYDYSSCKIDESWWCRLEENKRKDSYHVGSDSKK